MLEVVKWAVIMVLFHMSTSRFNFALFVHFRGVHEPWQFPERLQAMHDGVSVDDWPLPPSAGNATCSGSDSGVRAGDVIFAVEGA